MLPFVVPVVVDAAGPDLAEAPSRTVDELSLIEKVAEL